MSVSNDMDDWNEDKCIKLMREFRKRPLLWDQKDKSYYRKTLKPVAWDEIAKAVGMSEFCCRHKMGILMSSFRREKAKTINSRKLGDPAKYYYSCWFGFRYMAFLLDKNSERQRQARIKKGLEEDEYYEPEPDHVKLPMSNDVEIVEEDSNAVDDFDGLVVTNTITTPSPEPENEPEPELESKLKRITSSSDKNWSPKQKILKRDTNNDTVTSFFHYTNASSPSRDCEEEITHFSNYIAAKMRTYSETTKNAVQQAICELLFKADMAKDNFHSDLNEDRFNESEDTHKLFDIKVSVSDSE